MAEILRVHAADVAAEAASRLEAAVSRLHARRGGVRLAISGGSALGALASFRHGVGAEAWGGLRLTWVDERCVPFASEASNRGEAHRRGILDPAHPVGLELPLFLDGEDPLRACERVKAGLEASFGAGLDLALMGLGEDGHIASLFPGLPWAPAPALVQAVEESPKPPARRISLSLSLLTSIPEAILVVSGESKRGALRRLIQGDPALPGTRMQHLTVITDLDEPGGG